jgi:hypothetical protein
VQRREEDEVNLTKGNDMPELNTDEIRKSYEDGAIGSHWEGCYLVHPRCAIGVLCDEVEHLLVELERLKEKLKEQS